MDLQLSPDQAMFLQAAVAGGKYPSESDALDEAVLLLKKRDELREALEVGECELDAGSGSSANDVFARLERRAADLDRAAENPRS